MNFYHLFSVYFESVILTGFVCVCVCVCVCVILIPQIFMLLFNEICIKKDCGQEEKIRSARNRGHSKLCECYGSTFIPF